jgi:integrase/recombinase XerD
MTTRPISPLRRRMIEDMTIRQFGSKTQKDYVRVVRDFALLLGHSPDLAEPEDLRRYQLRLAAQGASPAKMNAAVSALRFFFKVTLGRSGFGQRPANIRMPERLPVVLSPEEVALLLYCAPGLKYKAALSVAYGAGLRASEIVHLKISDIDSARMLIRVEQGKGRKDRYVMLSPEVPPRGRPRPRLGMSTPTKASVPLPCRNQPRSLCRRDKNSDGDRRK